MRKLYPLAIAAALILAGVGGWVSSTIGARSGQVASTAQFDPLHAMSTAKDLPSHQYDLY